MQTKTVEKVLKRSLLYSVAMTQPFAIIPAHASPLQDESLFEQKQLHYGDHGELVRHVQLKLKKLGHYEAPVDGIYGLYTEQAVRSLQSAETMTINGKIDEQTYTTLLKLEKKEAFAQINSELQSIAHGDMNENVTKVQEVLYFYGYYQGEIDGIYGNLTEKAIERAKDEQLIIDTERTTTPISPSEQSEKDESTELSVKEVDVKEEPVSVPLDVSYYKDEIITKAKSLIGTPYVWGGSSPGGFDCSGFIQFVYEENDVTIPRTVNDIWNFSSPVSSPSIGDLVFFETYQAGPSHMGIYLGEGNFIHAGSSRGVEISNLQDNNYWKTRYLGSKRIIQ